MAVTFSYFCPFLWFNHDSFTLSSLKSTPLVNNNKKGETDQKLCGPFLSAICFYHFTRPKQTPPALIFFLARLEHKSFYTATLVSFSDMSLVWSFDF